MRIQSLSNADYSAKKNDVDFKGFRSSAKWSLNRTIDSVKTASPKTINFFYDGRLVERIAENKDVFVQAGRKPNSLSISDKSGNIVVDSMPCGNYVDFLRICEVAGHKAKITNLSKYTSDDTRKTFLSTKLMPQKLVEERVGRNMQAKNRLENALKNINYTA